MSSESIVLLKVRESGTPAARSYAFTVLIDGQTSDDRTFSPVESQELGEVSSQYQMLLDQSCKSETTDYLEILGSGLFHFFSRKSGARSRSRLPATKSCWSLPRIFRRS